MNYISPELWIFMISLIYFDNIIDNENIVVQNDNIVDRI